jgi:hypothetical protein
MIKVDTDPKAWALKYNLGRTKDNCRGCGVEVELNTPVMTKEWVGLESKPHEPCGERFKITVLRPRDKKTQELLNE